MNSGSNDHGHDRGWASNDACGYSCGMLWPCRTLIVLHIAARSRLTIGPLGFREALLVASREFFACVGKPKEVTRGGFCPNDMPMIKTVRVQCSR